MRTKLITILFTVVLCFGFKAQAQQNIPTVKEKIQLLPKASAIEFEEMMLGRTSFLLVSADNSIEWIERQGTSSKMIFLQKLANESFLSGSPHQALRASCELLLVDTSDNKDYSNLNNFDLKAYPKLKTIVLITNEDISKTEIDLIVKGIPAFSSIEILTSKIETEK